MKLHIFIDKNTFLNHIWKFTLQWCRKKYLTLPFCDVLWCNISVAYTKRVTSLYTNLSCEENVLQTIFICFWIAAPRPDNLSKNKWILQNSWHPSDVWFHDANWKRKSIMFSMCKFIEMMMNKHTAFKSHNNMVWFNPAMSGDAFMCYSIIGSDNGLSLVQCQAIIWTSVGILFIRYLWMYFSELWIKTLHFSYNKMNLKCCLQNDPHFVYNPI